MKNEDYVKQYYVQLMLLLDFRKLVYVQSTIAVFHVRRFIKNPILSPKVVFLFRSFMGPSVEQNPTKIFSLSNIN